MGREILCDFYMLYFDDLKGSIPKVLINWVNLSSFLFFLYNFNTFFFFALGYIYRYTRLHQEAGPSL